MSKGRNKNRENRKTRKEDRIRKWVSAKNELKEAKEERQRRRGK